MFPMLLVQTLPSNPLYNAELLQRTQIPKAELLKVDSVGTMQYCDKKLFDKIPPLTLNLYKSDSCNHYRQANTR